MKLPSACGWLKKNVRARATNCPVTLPCASSSYLMPPSHPYLARCLVPGIIHLCPLYSRLHTHTRLSLYRLVLDSFLSSAPIRPRLAERVACVQAYIPVDAYRFSFQMERSGFLKDRSLRSSLKTITLELESDRIAQFQQSCHDYNFSQEGAQQTSKLRQDGGYVHVDRACSCATKLA